jgi:hypothetical protein
MDFATILIWVSLILIGVSLLMMVVFGVIHGSHRFRDESKMGIAALLLPVLILLVAYAVSQSWTSAFVMAAVFTALSGFVALVVSGAKSLFT